MLDRLEPHAERITGLVSKLDAAEPGGTACLELVGTFPPTSESEPVEAHEGLGWFLNRRGLGFLSRTGVDVDEYGD